MSRSKSDTPAQQPTLELDALQEASWDIWDQKYRLKDHQGESVDKTVSGTWERVADALAELEPKQKAHWRKQFSGRWKTAPYRPVASPLTLVLTNTSPPPPPSTARYPARLRIPCRIFCTKTSRRGLL